MNKNLLIFGANGELGKGIAETLIQKDYKDIFLFDFKFDEKIEGVEQILILDLSEEQNVIEAFKTINVKNDEYYFMYSTIGGFFGGKKIWETSEEDFDRMLNMNLKTNFLLAKHFAKIVSKSSGGSACFTSAYTADNPEAEKFVYGASKAALSYLVKTLALEGESIKLSVNGIAPLIIDTKANREWMKNANYSSWMKPKEIGEFVHDLFNNFNFISGNIIKLKNRFEKL